MPTGGNEAAAALPVWRPQLDGAEINDTRLIGLAMNGRALKSACSVQQRVGQSISQKSGGSGGAMTTTQSQGQRPFALHAKAIALCLEAGRSLALLLLLAERVASTVARAILEPAGRPDSRLLASSRCVAVAVAIEATRSTLASAS